MINIFIEEPSMSNDKIAYDKIKAWIEKELIINTDTHLYEPRTIDNTHWVQVSSDKPIFKENINENLSPRTPTTCR